MTATFTWCPAPGAARERQPRLNEITYGDGYSHRATFGLNILQDAWTVTFPGDEPMLLAIDSFLGTNAVPGFWWTPPGHDGQILVVCDQWQLSYTDKRGGAVLMGSLSATFKRSYNLQP